MLITLCYIYLWVRFQKFYTGVIRSAVFRLRESRSSVAFCAHTVRSRVQSGSDSAGDKLFLSLGNKVIYITEPQACDDLSRWTLLGSSLVNAPKLENIAFIIEATTRQRAVQPSQTQNKQVLNWLDYCLPLACSPGQPYRAVAETSLDNFSTLGVAFLEDRLHMENGLIPEKIVSVLLRESMLKELLEKQQPGVEEKLGLLPTGFPDNVALSSASKCEQEAERFPEVQQVELKHSIDHHHMDGHHLHLSSCHECLELENSTIQSVKYASAENIPDLPDDFTDSEGDVEADANLSDWRGPVKASNRPPNVLVFTGGCDERYGRMRSLLAECIANDRYIIYPLQPQQALDEPWLETTQLLVLASEDALTPELQLRFLTYLGQGGKVLGLSCSLCPAGLKLLTRKERRGQVCSLNFTKADSTEVHLSILASGSSFVREPHDGSRGEVELWGELSAGVDEEKDMVIVRVTHGADGGEAILCQVQKYHRMPLFLK